MSIIFDFRCQVTYSNLLKITNHGIRTKNSNYIIETVLKSEFSIQSLDAYGGSLEAKRFSSTINYTHVLRE